MKASCFDRVKHSIYAPILIDIHLRLLCEEGEDERAHCKNCGSWFETLDKSLYPVLSSVAHDLHFNNVRINGHLLDIFHSVQNRV